MKDLNDPEVISAFKELMRCSAELRAAIAVGQQTETAAREARRATTVATNAYFSAESQLQSLLGLFCTGAGGTLFEPAALKERKENGPLPNVVEE